MSFDARDAIILRKENNLSPDRKFPHDGMIPSKDNSQLRNTIYGSMTPVGNFANSVVKSARTVRRESDASRPFPLFAKSILTSSLAARRDTARKYDDDLFYGDGAYQGVTCARTRVLYLHASSDFFSYLRAVNKKRDCGA